MNNDIISLQNLGNFLAEFAERSIVEKGGFHPFAGVVKNTGEIALVMGYGGSEKSSSVEAVKFLEEGLARAAVIKQYQTVGICTDVRMKNSNGVSDAICMDIEHKDGPAMRFLEPYKKRLWGGYSFGRLEASVIEHAIFKKGGLTDT